MTTGVPRALLRAAFVVALVVVFGLAMVPIPARIEVFSFQDLGEHAVAFAVLTALGLAAWPASTTRVAGGLLLYGVLIEVAQHLLTTHRVGDPLDVLADWVGMGVALVAVRTARGATSA